MNDKYFIITIDTEGDNVWAYKPKKSELLIPETKNAGYLWRFQSLCEKYNFCPTYLTDYEMAKSSEFIEFGRNVIKKDRGEVGMHMHAFSTPPFYELTDLRGRGLAFAGEYPQKILYQKMEYMTKTLQDTFQTEILSHRGGRWYLDRRILKMLDRLGYLADCTVTPGISWKASKGQTGGSEGSDYSYDKLMPYRIKGTHLWELPVTIQSRIRLGKEKRSFIQREKIWMRPDGRNLSDLLWLVKKNQKSSTNYIEFMLHSSELMAGGSPAFRTEKAIERLYSHMDVLFACLKEKGYTGITCSEYVKRNCGV